MCGTQSDQNALEAVAVVRQHVWPPPAFVAATLVFHSGERHPSSVSVRQRLDRDAETGGSGGQAPHAAVLLYPIYQCEHDESFEVIATSTFQCFQ